MLAVLAGAALPSAGAERWHREVLGRAQTHSLLTQAGTAGAFRLEHLHPAMLTEMAEQLGVPPEAIPTLISEGYARTAEAVNVSRVVYDGNSARFGETGARRWGAVTLSMAGTFVDTGRAIPQACLWMVVFSDGDAWYFEVLAQPLTAQLLASALPDMAEPVSTLPDASCPDE